LTVERLPEGKMRVLDDPLKQAKAKAAATYDAATDQIRYGG
jgi:hypothetical protein